MFNKKGFALIETIITMVVLLTALVLLYSSFNNAYIKEQNSLYFDDIAYLYKTEYIERLLFGDTEIDGYIDTSSGNPIEADTKNYHGICVAASSEHCSYVYLLGYNSNYYNSSNVLTNIINPDYSGYLKDIINAYNIDNIMYVDITNLQALKDCINEQDSSPLCSNTQNIINIFYASLTDSNNKIKNFIKKLDVEQIEKDLVEFNTAGRHEPEAILIVSYYETKNGAAVNANNRDYATCIKDPTKKTMDCEKAINVSWVYVDEKN